MTEKTRNLTEKPDGRRMEAQNILTPRPSLLILALFGIFGTKLICYTFLGYIYPQEGNNENGSSILTWPGSGVTDGLMVSPEGLTAFATSRGLAYDPNDSCPHVGPAFSSINPIDNGTNQSLYASPLNILGIFSLIEY